MKVINGYNYHVRSIVALFTLFCIATNLPLSHDSRSDAGELVITIPEKFFRGEPQPGDTVRLVYTCPTSLELFEQERGWWNACAKMEILTARGSAHQVFLQAYLAARNDPELGTTGVSYEAWTRGTEADKAAIRARLHRAVQTIIARHGLRELLRSASAPVELVAGRVAENQLKLADILGVSSSDLRALVTYCPGAYGNVSVNQQHRLFPQLSSALQDPVVSARYQRELENFGVYLDTHPMTSHAERDLELKRLMAPLMQTLNP